MGAPLHVLVVDDRPDSIRFLLEFLLARDHRLEKCGGRQAAANISSARQSGVPFDLVLMSMELTGGDAMTLLRDLRMRKDPTAVAIYTPFSEVTPAMFQEAERIDCMFLDQPLELRRVEQLLNDIGSKRARGGIGSGGHPRSDKDKDQPFFGTARSSRSTTVSDSSHYFSQDRQGDPPAKTPAQPPIAKPAGTSALAAQPAPAARNANSFPDAVAKPASEISNTARIRRSVAGNFTDAPQASGDFTGTARIRRAVTGSIRADQVGAGAIKAPVANPERRVLCAACRREFMVAAKAETFNAPCVHCGQLNRIDPL